MKDLFFSLDERLDSITPIPDAVDDPEGFKLRIQEDAKRKVEREAKRTAPVKEVTSDKVNVAPNKHTKETLNTMEIVEKSLHTDFDAVIGPVMVELQSNPVLVHRMYSSDNPAKAIYDYGKAIIDADKNDKANLIAQGQVESGDKSSEFSKVNSKYSYNGKPMNEVQVASWLKLGLPIDKIVTKK